MIAASAAAGITLALGTPIGGLIFGMEVTSSIYLINNIVKAISCATICIVTSKILNVANKNMNLFVPQKLVPTSDNADVIFNADTIFFVILGVIGGFIGAALCTFVSKLSYIRRKSSLKVLNNRFLFAAIAAVLISAITFTLKPLMIFDRYMLSHIFNINFPCNVYYLDELNHPYEGMLLIVLFFFKFAITVISLSINMPTGVFAPFFLIGAYFGRWYGHMIRMAFSASEEAIFAMVGAACVMSGATHSISSAIIIYELTGQSSYLIPMLMACLIANLTAQAVSMSFFDIILLMKNLPHLPSIKSSTLYKLDVGSIMSKELYPIAFKNFNYINSLQLLFSMPKGHQMSIPLIDEHEVIQYQVLAKKLVKYLYCLFENYKLNYETDIQLKIQSVVYFLRKKYGHKHSNFFSYLSYKFQKIFLTKKDKERIKLNKILEYEKVSENLNFLTHCKRNS